VRDIEDYDRKKRTNSMEGVNEGCSRSTRIRLSHKCDIPCFKLEMSSKPAAPRALSGANAAFNDKVALFSVSSHPSHHSVGETYGASAFELGCCQRSVISISIARIFLTGVLTSDQRCR
jgi:hypothetical protein